MKTERENIETYSTSTNNSTKNILNYIITFIAIFMVIWAIISTQRNIIAPVQNVVLHGGLAMLLVFLNNLKKKINHWPFYAMMISLSVISVGYILIRYNDLIQHKGALNLEEMIIGAILFIVFFAERTDLRILSESSFGEIASLLKGFINNSRASPSIPRRKRSCNIKS